MKLFNSAQMRTADAAAAEAGVSVERLMESAGAVVAARLVDLFPAAGTVLVLCGKGNNGGDGYVAARRLLERGLTVEVWELSATPTTPVAVKARAAALEGGARPVRLEASDLARRVAAGPAPGTVIVDALLGCGLDRPLTGLLADVVALVNASEVPVLAVDVPSGVGADSGQLAGPHIRAHTTVQLAGAKLASAFYPARAAYTHALEPAVDAGVVDIGIPDSILSGLSTITLLTSADCSRWLPARAPTAHKYSAGTVTVVAGSSTYSGAAELACRGAWRGGAGLVTLVSQHRHPSAWPETVYREQSPAAAWPPAGLTHNAAGACVVGPGLVADAATVLSAVLAWAQGPVVVDAGALTPEVLWPTLDAARTRHLPTAGEAGYGAREPRVVLTPHAGEAARLLSTTSTVVDADPLGSAALLSRRSGAVVVLKGPTTVIAEPGGHTAVSTRGHPGMASGGTGDVLAGLLGALAAAPVHEAGGEDDDLAPDTGHPKPVGSSLFQRACLAAFVHGLAGERAAAKHGDSLIASDLVDELGGVLAGLYGA